MDCARKPRSASPLRQLVRRSFATPAMKYELHVMTADVEQQPRVDHGRPRERDPAATVADDSSVSVMKSLPPLKLPHQRRDTSMLATNRNA